MQSQLEIFIMTQKRQHRRNYNEPGHAHELTFTCYRGFKSLNANRTCQWLAEAINEARVELNFDLWTYVFMPEHVHLIVRPTDRDYDIADIKKAIKAPVGSKAIEYLLANAPDWIPRITRKRGKRTERVFWQSGGGFDRNVIKPGTLMKMIDYIHMNPVRRGLVEKPEDWKWSSTAWYLRGGEGPIRVDPIPPEWLDDSL
jgi:putative transposase